MDDKGYDNQEKFSRNLDICNFANLWHNHNIESKILSRFVLNTIQIPCFLYRSTFTYTNNIKSTAFTFNVMCTCFFCLCNLVHFLLNILLVPVLFALIQSRKHDRHYGAGIVTDKAYNVLVIPKIQRTLRYLFN